jgi:hypothetical protein
VKSAVVAALLVTTPLLAQDARVSALVEQGDAADARHDSRTALRFLYEAERMAPPNLGVLLRISKQYGDLSRAAKDPAEAKALAEKALEFGRRALALDDRNAKAHLNLAVSYGKLTEFAGNKQKVEYAKMIHDEARRSIELDPGDDYAWHVLGRWHAEVANLNTVLRTIANYVYGGLPPASTEDAVRCFKKAVELAPQRVLHHAELAKTYVKGSRPEAAAQEWQNVLGLKPNGADDEQYQRDARIALEQYRKAASQAGRGLVRR